MNWLKDLFFSVGNVEDAIKDSFSQQYSIHMSKSVQY